MNFRQRIAWLAVVVYLALTCGILYYIFELNDSFNAYALDHVEKYHNKDQSKDVQEMLNAHLQKNAGAQESADEHDVLPAGTIVFSFLWHVTDVPLAVWMLILLLPYLQVFFMLLACTKPQPQLSVAYLWPILLYIRVRSCYWRLSGRDMKPLNSHIPNGHTLLDT